MQIRPSFHGALLALCICLLTSSLCYGDDKTLEAAGQPSKVFSELKTSEAAELNEEGHNKVPILKKPFPPLHKIPTFQKPIPVYKKKHPSPIPEEEKFFPPIGTIIPRVPKFKPPHVTP